MYYLLLAPCGLDCRLILFLFSTFQCLESRHTSHGRNTIKLFEEYVKKRDSTVKKLKKALEDMDRPDALQVLLDSMPGKVSIYCRF